MEMPYITIAKRYQGKQLCLFALIKPLRRRGQKNTEAIARTRIKMCQMPADRDQSLRALFF